MNAEYGGLLPSIAHTVYEIDCSMCMLHGLYHTNVCACIAACNGHTLRLTEDLLQLQVLPLGSQLL